MTTSTNLLQLPLCPLPNEWGGTFLLDAPLMATRDAFVPALPHTSRPPVAPSHLYSESERHLRRSYVLVEKLRQAVSR